MVTQISPAEYLANYSQLPTIDVRSPKEYNHAHLPGALSIPLFSDQERAIIGTLYKQVGRTEAVRKGLEIVAPHMLSFVDQLKNYTDQKNIVVHCWRGGMRSHSVAMLFSLAGYTAYQIIGGYKAVKQELRKHIATNTYQIILLGGKTGSGKTELLNKLKKSGEQIVDLEGLAQHKGSAYGQLGNNPQPSQEQFILSLFWEFYYTSPQKNIWIEHEGSRIGSLHIPPEITQKLETAPVIYIEIPYQERIDRIMKDYGIHTSEDLINCTKLLEKQLGNKRMQEICTAIQNKQITTAIEHLLEHYDRSYAFATKQNNHNRFLLFDAQAIQPDKRISALINFAHDVCTRTTT